MLAASPLFTPFELGPLRLPNRFVMPAMQRGQCVDGCPTPALAEYYRRRAQGGVPISVSSTGTLRG